MEATKYEIISNKEHFGFNFQIIFCCDKQ